jgi:HD-like signal output (HDOD) protein
MFDLEKLIDQASNLEPLPTSVTRLAALVSRDDSDLKEIVEVISFDQALTAKLLRSANSASAASRTQVTHVKDAVVRMGMGTILALAVSASVKKQVSTAIPEYGMPEGYLWKHSVAASLSTEITQAFCPIRLPAESFTAALMHDIGKLVLARFLNPNTLRLLHQANTFSDVLTPELETEVLGVHHGEVGGLMAQHWKLPDMIIRGITYHHYPEAGGALICYVVALADIVAKQVGTKMDLNLLYTQNQPIMDELKITAPNFTKICNMVTLKFDDLCKKFD